METDIGDIRLLEDLERLFENGNLRLGFDTEALLGTPLTVELVDETNSE